MLLLAACSGGGGGGKAAPSTTTTSPSPSTERRSPQTTAPARTADDAAWVGQGPRPVSGLVGAGGRIVYLGVDDEHRLQLIGLNPATGAVAWNRPSTAATHVAGFEQRLVVEGDTVFNVEPAGAANSRVAFPAQAADPFEVVAVDAATGRDLWHHPFGESMSTPLHRCGDGVCVLEDAPGRHVDITRLSFTTGAVTSEGAAAFDPLIGEDGELAISSPSGRDTFVLTSGFGKKVEWEHPRSELFGSVDVAPDTGWEGLHTGGVWIAWLGSPDGSDGATSGIADDGTLLWTQPRRPCPLIPDSFDFAVLCGHLDSSLHQFTLGTIEGVDPLTGTTQWSFDAGSVDVLQPGSNIVRLDATHFGLHVGSGNMGLDYATGATNPLADGKGWCPRFGDFVQVEDAESIVATSWSPCTLEIGPDHVPPTAVPDFAGPSSDGFGAWVENGEVRAAKVG
ncbi:MAG: hypothetical protein QOD38_245 [Acidimicrobiaceae bacterium]